MPASSNIPTAAATQDDYVERLSCLRKVERQFTADADPSPTRYVRWNNYLIAPSFLCQTILQSLVRRQTHPLLSVRNVGRFLQHWGAGQLATVDSSACMIEARPHWRESGFIRTFYTRPRTTMKISIGSQSGAGRIAREIHTRQVVQQIGEIPVPPLYEHWKTPHYHALREAWIHGRPSRRRHVPLLMSQLLPRMERHHRGYKIREMSLAESGMACLAERVAAAAELFAWPDEWVEKGRFLKTIEGLEAAQLALPAGFGHGDFSLGHIMILKDGSPIVIDWDGGGEQPIARDLADLCRSVRPFNDRLVDESLTMLRRFCKPSTYSAEAQLLIFSLRWAALYRYFQTAYAEQGRAERVKPTMRRVFHIAQRLMREHEGHLFKTVFVRPWGAGKSPAPRKAA